MHSNRCCYRKIYYSQTAADVCTEGFNMYAQQQIFQKKVYDIHTQQQKYLQKDIIFTNSSRSPYRRIYYSQPAAAVFTEGYGIHAQQQIS